MKHVALSLALIVCFACAAARASTIDGSVYLLRNIGPQFTSMARADYLDDLMHHASAELSGAHRVTGPQVFQTAVTGNGLYSYDLEGPAQAGGCYTTDLHVIADPPYPWHTLEATFVGPEMVCLVVGSPPPPEYTVCVQGNNDCQDPLVLDLNGDGIHTTGTADVVWFDLDGDGAPERTAWTNPTTAEGFLYLDLDHKGRVTSGRELFGVGTVMPDGSRGHDGFTALALYDGTANGGNGDGALNADDTAWNRLRIWIDTNHNGICDPSETGPLHEYGVQEIDIRAVSTNAVDDAGNLHQLASVYHRRVMGTTHQRQRADAIHAISFQRAQ